MMLAILKQASGSQMSRATNKCLARINKTRTGAKAIDKRPAARRNFVRRQPPGALKNETSSGGSVYDHHGS
jgi:hypothetical protein